MPVVSPQLTQHEYTIPTRKGVMSLGELAEASGVHRITLSRIFRKLHTPSIRTARSLAKVMGLDLDEVYSMFPGPERVGKNNT